MKKRYFVNGFILLLVLVAFRCQSPLENQKLPIIGEKQIVDGDTIYHKILDFSFVNQDSQVVNNDTFDGKIYVADFFFTSCPTICPKMKKQMLRLYEKYEKDDRIRLLSHSIDTKRDTVGKLKSYASSLGVSSDKWLFVTGDKDEIFEMADDYFSIVRDDSNAPGGFDHSGRFILVDKDRFVRSFCDGTDPESVDQFMRDIDLLLKQEY